MSMTLDQAVQMGKAIGMDLQPSAKPISHDPLQGYDRSTLTKVVGNKAVSALIEVFQKDLESSLSGNFSLDDHIVARHSFTVSRGKNKGFQGVAVRHMPSKYDEKDTTFVLYCPFKSEEVFCNTKSAKITAWRVGELSMLISQIKMGSESSLVRGQQVFGDKKVGVVVAQPKQRNGSPLYSVGVQWQGEAQEAWTFPHLLRLEA